ncbi:MAG: isochorismatase family protein [Polyangiales bacterium]
MQRLLPQSTALLVIDVQERLAPAMEPKAYERLLRSLDVLLSAAQLLQVPTAATEQYPKGLGDTVEPVRALLDGLKVQRIAKTAFSACDAPDVARWLGTVAPRAVVVVGVESHVCVFQTVRELAARGIDVHVPHDAVASRRDDDKQIALDLMRRAGATITTTETVVFDWLQKAEGDAFKALSKKIR